jgi:hypothetical protein
MERLLGAAAGLTFLSACAQTPDVVYKYYPTKSVTTITVTQALACNASGTSLYSTETPAVTTAYSADDTRQPFSVAIAQLDNPLADADIGFKYTADGRLLSINQTTTGEAGAAIKSALSLAAAAFALGGAEGNLPPPPIANECATLKKLGAGKPVPLVYAIEENLAKDAGKTIPLDDDNVNDPTTFDALNSQAFPHLSVQISAPVKLESGASEVEADASSTVQLTLQNQLAATISFIKIPPAKKGLIYAMDYVIFPDETPGATYLLPIPKAALFGSENFALTLTDSGAISSIEYGKHSGASSALDSATGVVTTASGAQADALNAQIANEKAQDNAIAESVAHAQCLAQPSACK